MTGMWLVSCHQLKQQGYEPTAVDRSVTPGIVNLRKGREVKGIRLKRKISENIMGVKCGRDVDSIIPRNIYNVED